MRTYFFLLFFLIEGNIYAQQDPFYSQFWNTQQRFNPSVTGMKEQNELHVLARWQWVEISGAPKTQLITYGSKLNKLNSGIGFVYEHDQTGFLRNHNVKMNYAYHLKFKDAHHLSFGVAAGTNIQSLNGLLIFPDTSIAYNDRGVGFTSDLGMFYTFKRFDLGLSLTRIAESRALPMSKGMPHYYLYMGHVFGKKEGLQIKPQVFYRYNNGFAAFDLNTLFAYRSIYQLGLTFRNGDSYGITAAYTFKKILNISYSYDTTVSKLNNGVAGGSHEVHLGLCLKHKSSKRNSAAE